MTPGEHAYNTFRKTLIPHLEPEVACSWQEWHELTECEQRAWEEAAKSVLVDFLFQSLNQIDPPPEVASLTCERCQRGFFSEDDCNMCPDCINDIAESN